MTLARFAGVLTRCLLAIVVAGAPHAVAATTSADPRPCEQDSSFALLDFWLGSWNVYVGEQLAGTNRIERILDGCAVRERWVSVEGDHGESLFYRIPAESTWKQVWVTEHATVPGGVKEKRLVRRLPDGSVRFQGTIQRPKKGAYLDRTTLTPLDGGDVRQVIEVSTDGGKTWRSLFDARYTRRE